MLGKALRHPCPAPSHPPATHYQRGLHNRRTALAYAQQLTAAQAAAATARPDSDESKGKPVIQVQVTRPSLPCEKPLPLANVMEIQRLLYLLEAPEYCMRAFREHGVNGQDLLHMQDDDLDDSRFKFPRHVQRKVLRIAEAWRSFQSVAGSPTKGSITLDQFMQHNGSISLRSSESLSHLQAAFRALDVNNNGNITFEEFLVGFTLLEAAVAAAESARDPNHSANAGSAIEATSATAAAATAKTNVATTTLTTINNNNSNPTSNRRSMNDATTASDSNGGFLSSVVSWFQM